MTLAVLFSACQPPQTLRDTQSSTAATPGPTGPEGPRGIDVAGTPGSAGPPGAQGPAGLSSVQLSLGSFGAVCDGITDDTQAFTDALKSLASRGGTLLLPADKTCRITQLNFAQLGPLGAPARGLLVRGEGHIGVSGGASTVLVEPNAPTAAQCTALTDDPASAQNGNGGLTFGPNTAFLRFENFELKAGPNLRSCLVNISQVGSGDPHHIDFHRVAFMGTSSVATPLHALVYMFNASWPSFDRSWFGGSRYAIFEDYASGYTSNPIITGNIFYRLVGGTYALVPALQLSGPAGAHIAGNNFEYGPYGIYIGTLFGGSVTDNWFNTEGEMSGSGAWIDIGCAGCSVTGNHMQGGEVGIMVRGQGARVSNNYLIGLGGTGVVVTASSSTIENNFFHGSQPATPAAIEIAGGQGNTVRLNASAAIGTLSAATRLVHLHAGTSGTLELEQLISDNPTAVLNDAPGRWKIDRGTSAVLELPTKQASVSDATNEATVVLSRINGAPTDPATARLGLEADCGQNAELVLRDPAGGGYGGFAIEKAGVRRAQISGGGLAPTYFSVGKVGVGTTDPKESLEVVGNTYLSSPGSAVILRSPNGLVCRQLGIDDAGAMTLTAVACP